MGKEKDLVERSLVVLKPDTVQRGIVGEVITRFERVGLKIVGMKMVMPDEDQYRAHYEDIGQMITRRGEQAFRYNLSYMMTGLETKNGDELAAIYDNLTLPYTEAQIEAFNTAYHFAYAVTVWDNIDNFDIEGIYGELVEATKAIDPNFTVDLTGVELLEPGNPVQPEKPLPSLPNTGADKGEDNSAKMIEAAVIGVAMLVLVTGGVVTAKRFILSPLKRKH